MVFCSIWFSFVCSFSALTLLVGSFDPLKPVPDMTYDVFGGTLSLTQSINLRSYSQTLTLPVVYLTRAQIAVQCCTTGIVKSGVGSVQGHSRSVFALGTNQKLIYHFVLVNNTDIHRVSHDLQVITQYCSNVCC